MESTIYTALSRAPSSILMSFGTDFAEQAAKRFQRKYQEQLRQEDINQLKTLYSLPSESRST